MWGSYCSRETKRVVLVEVLWLVFLPPSHWLIKMILISQSGVYADIWELIWNLRMTELANFWKTYLNQNYDSLFLQKWTGGKQGSYVGQEGFWKLFSKANHTDVVILKQL